MHLFFHNHLIFDHRAHAAFQFNQEKLKHEKVLQVKYICINIIIQNMSK